MEPAQAGLVWSKLAPPTPRAGLIARPGTRRWRRRPRGPAPTSVDYGRMVLPSLLNDLSGTGAPLVLVLDDVHLVTNPTCHRTVSFFLRHLPAGVHLLLATRVDQPLSLAGMRARGEVAELRAAELGSREPGLACVLHRRAMDWHRRR